jgi:signal transduction histidine kinase
MDARDDGLWEWRRRATDLVIGAAVLLHTPALLLFLAGYGPPSLWPFRVPITIVAVLVAFVGLMRRWPHPFRVWVVLGALYAFAMVGAFVVPQGPWTRALPIAAPILAIVLIGATAARVAIGLSAGVLLVAPWLRGLSPWPSGALSLDAQFDLTVGHMFVQNLALTADMVVLMILLESFYHFLLQSLERARSATAERTAAGRKLEAEIEERRRLQNEIARVGDEERRHLGQEVHDGVCQQLTGAVLRCQALELRLERGTAPTLDELRALSSLLGDTIREAHSVAQGLCPLEPTPGALAMALRALAQRSQQMSGIECRFSASGDILVPDAIAAHHMYRVAQEAVSNAVRHANARRIAIELKGSDADLELKVEDDGVGMPEVVPAGGMGLRTMGFRAQIVEGVLAVEPASGGGTRVSCRVPRPALARHAAERPLLQEGLAI